MGFVVAIGGRRSGRCQVEALPTQRIPRDRSDARTMIDRHANHPSGQATNASEHVSAPHMVVQLLSQPRYLAPTRRLLNEFCRQFGFDDRCAGQVALAVDEAICNVIRHGYGQRTDGPIWIKLWPIAASGRHSGGIRIVIEDEARQIDPAQIKGRPLDEIRPGGLGVHIIREVMDEVVYERRDGAGMRLSLVRRLPEAGGRELEPEDAGEARPGSCSKEGCGKNHG